MEKDPAGGLTGWAATPWSDRALAAAAVVATAVAAALCGRYSRAETAMAVVVGAGMGVLVLRRQRALLTVAVVGATTVVEASLTTSGNASVLMVTGMVAFYSLGAHAGRRSAAVGVVLGVLTVAGAQAAAPASGYSAASSLGLFAVLLVLVPFGVGRIVRSRAVLGGRLEVVTARLHQTASDAEGSLLADERARLARSLESSALRGVDALAAYAEVARLEQVEAIEAIARQALGEVRRLLVSLRGDPDPGPVPSLGELRVRVQAALSSAGDRPSPDGRVPGGWSLVAEGWIDRALAVLAAAYGAGMVATTAAHSRPLPLAAGLAAAVAMGLSVALLRRAPLAATAASAAAAVAYSALTHPADPVSGVQPTALLILAPFALGAWERSRLRSSAGLVLCLAGLVGMVLADPSAVLRPGAVGPTPAFIFGTFAIGAVLQARTEKLSQLADAALRLDQARRQQMTLRMRAERAKVARELHDALAHSLTAILLQATAARRVWHSDPELAKTHAGVLRTTLAETGGELRQLIVALALGADVEVGLEQIPSLVERARTSGLDVAIRVEGSARQHSPEAGVAAYRIVQEALTNVARHAPGSSVTVEIGCLESELCLRITNGSPATPAWQVPGGGNGIAGMRERARCCGGQLDAAPVPGGGFAVAGRLPLRAGT